LARIASLLLGLHLICCPSLVLAEDSSRASAPSVRHFGAPIELEVPTSLSEVLAHPEEFANRSILIAGRITDVCKKRGCWTVLADGDAHLRIRFKDYGFFLPSDIRGRFALAEGMVRVEMQSQETARHYARESQEVDPEAIVGERRVVAFTASGVRLIDSDD
jgi:hypothetical protein